METTTPNARAKDALQVIEQALSKLRTEQTKIKLQPSQRSTEQRLESLERRVEQWEKVVEKLTQELKQRTGGDKPSGAELKAEIAKKDEQILALQDKLNQTEQLIQDIIKSLQPVLHGLLNEQGDTAEKRAAAPQTSVDAFRSKFNVPTRSTSAPDPTDKPQVQPKWGDNISYPPGFNPRRRFSVSDEVRRPDSKFKKLLTIHPKRPEVRQRILATISTNFLFKQLDEEQLEQCLDVMFERRLQAGEVIIRQGDTGDNFYVIDSGSFDVIQNGKTLATISTGRSFGELALMYNCMRTATILAREESVVWGMDRTAFRHILMDYTIKKRQLYENFLENVPILSSLNYYERTIIADALESFKFGDGEVIIRQGEEGDKFYIIEEGVVVVTQTKGNERPIEVMRLSKGMYFGEVALLTNNPRAATVTAVGMVKCLGMTRQDFTQLMGPCDQILKRNMENYKSYEYYLRNQSPIKETVQQSNNNKQNGAKKKKKKKKNAMKAPNTP